MQGEGEGDRDLKKHAAKSHNFETSVHNQIHYTHFLSSWMIQLADWQASNFSVLEL